MAEHHITLSAVVEEKHVASVIDVLRMTMAKLALNDQQVSLSVTPLPPEAVE